MPVGQLSDALVAYLDGKGAKPVTRAIAITDRVILRMMRPSLVHGGKAVPERVLRRMLSIFNEPKAVLWDRRSKHATLLFVFEVEGEERLGQFSVKIRSRDRKARRRRNNFVTSAYLMDHASLKRRGTIVSGEL